MEKNTWLNRWIVMIKSLINWAFLHACLLNGKKFLCVPIFSVNIHVTDKYCLLSNDRASNNSCLSSVSKVRNHQFGTELVMRRNIKELCVIDSPLVALRRSHFGTTLAPGHVRQVNNLVFWIDDATATRGQLGGRIRFGYGQYGGESGTEF